MIIGVSYLIRRVSLQYDRNAVVTVKRLSSSEKKKEIKEKKYFPAVGERGRPYCSHTRVEFVTEE